MTGYRAMLGDCVVAVEADGVSERNAAWTYRHPSPLASKIKNRVAFWDAVRVDEL